MHRPFPHRGKQLFFPSVSLAVPRCALLLCLIALPAAAQITMDTRTGVVTNGVRTGATVDRRYQQVEPTHIDLPKAQLDEKTRLELIRLLESEQGFAMRPFPKGHKGLILSANGGVQPFGEDWVSLVTSQGMCAKPGDRLLLTDIKILADRIVFQINGGPDRKHRFLRHIEVGGGGRMNPIVQGDDADPLGARLTLQFHGRVPQLTGAQVKALLAPLISFDLKTPIQAFTDTLPPQLKSAILDHHVLVGMSTDMVLFSRGQPERKIREMEGQMPFEEWIYGKPPEEVDFVRINGNRVIRVETAKVGEAPRIFEKDEVDGLMRTDGTPLFKEEPKIRTVAEGDVVRDPDTQAPAAPPSLRSEGEALPQDSDKRTDGPMRPVHFPAQKPASDPGQSPGEDSASPAATPANPAQPPPPPH